MNAYNLAIALSVMGHLEREEMDNPWAKNPKLEKYPQAMYWKGKYVYRMDRPELIDALSELWDLYRADKESDYDRQIKMFQNAGFPQ